MSPLLIAMPRFMYLLMTLLGALANGAIAAAPPDAPKGVSTVHLHNVFRVTPRFLSGNAPADSESFAELARLGVKTLISVDGAKPDVEAARRHGLRYIHLPIGYDGVPTQRVAELAKAAQSAAGPVYVHCHHGLHRGPAAVALMCQATEGWSTNQALAWMRQAGTSPDYPGLYQSAARFRPPSPEALSRITDLPQVTQSSSLVDAMVSIDEGLDRLKAAHKADWAKIPANPDLTPAHAATLLWEQLRELLRAEDTTKRPADYRNKLETAVTAADRLRQELTNPASTAATRDLALRNLTGSCSACHKTYRN